MPGYTRPTRPVSRRADPGKVAFGEISCPRKTLYAGEVVPVEIRYYFDANYPVEIRGKVDFGAEGVVTERFPDPKEGREERDGVEYNVLTFKTLLSAVKPGVVTIPAAKLDSRIQIPGAVPPGFDDPIFRQLLGGNSPFSESKDVMVTTAPLRLEILPLPKEGRPASFSGAVGQFDIDAIIANPKPAPGDPATLSVKIGGKGNFKGMGAPVLTDEEGWRSYPPTDKFDSSDELSYSGVKSFDFTLIAQEPKKSSPGAEFSYFDPTTARYVTLATKPLPLDASPGGASQASAGTPSSPNLPPAPSSTPPVPGDVPKEGAPAEVITLRSWSTPASRPEFVAAMLAMLAAALSLAGILWYRDLQSRGGSEASRKRRRIDELRRVLRSESADAASLHEAAIEFTELTLPDSEKKSSLLADLSGRRDLFKYGIGGTRPLPEADRRRLLELLGETSSPR
jgi:hypothetical protein